MNMSFTMFDRLSPAYNFAPYNDICDGFRLEFREYGNQEPLPSPCQPAEYPVNRDFVVDYGLNSFRYSGSISIGLSP
jgi:hypothetical protein